MTGPEALARLEALGAQVALLPGDALEVDAPRVPEIDALFDALRRDKPQAVAVLRSRARIIPLPPERPRRAIPADAAACPACQGTAFWTSLAMVRICERCHPPATERIVATRGKTPATLPQAARSGEGPAPATPPRGGAA